MKKILLGILLVLVFIQYLSSILSAVEINLDPNIETISSGPILWKDEKTGIRFRMITILSEVYLNIYIQKIEFGEESCCAKVIKTYEIDPEKLEGKNKLFSVTDIQWLSFDSVRFKGNSTIYTLKKLNGEYECIRGKEEGGYSKKENNRFDSEGQ